MHFLPWLILLVHIAMAPVYVEINAEAVEPQSPPEGIKKNLIRRSCSLEKLYRRRGLKNRRRVFFPFTNRFIEQIIIIAVILRSRCPPAQAQIARASLIRRISDFTPESLIEASFTIPVRKFKACGTVFLVS